MVLLLNPIERAWSHIVMDLCKRQRKTIDELEEAEVLQKMYFYGCIMRTKLH